MSEGREMPGTKGDFKSTDNEGLEIAESEGSGVTDSEDSAIVGS